MQFVALASSVAYGLYLKSSFKALSAFPCMLKTWLSCIISERSTFYNRKGRINRSRRSCQAKAIRGLCGQLDPVGMLRQSRRSRTADIDESLFHFWWNVSVEKHFFKFKRQDDKPVQLISPFEIWWLKLQKSRHSGFLVYELWTNGRVVYQASLVPLCRIIIPCFFN